MKAVMLSIQPKWVDKIIKGEKTIEVRKNRPKLKTPFKCYIYCTYGNVRENYCLGKTGKVVGEFVCDYIREYEPTKAWTLYGKAIHYLGNALEYRHTALYYDEIEEYGNGATLYAWHISELKIYDKPKELSEFRLHDKTLDYAFLGDIDRTYQIKRPPQSWCYVEVNDEREIDTSKME